MHVYVHYFVCKFNEFEWISGKNEAETYRKCVKKSLLFLFGGGVKFEFWIAEKCIFFFYLMLICLRIVYRFWTCTGSSLRTDTASIIIVEGTWNPFLENKNIGLLRWKHPYFWGKTSVLLPKEVRCFTVSGTLHRIIPFPLYKKSFWKSPTFPTPRHQMPCVYWQSRVKDRV